MNEPRDPKGGVEPVVFWIENVQIWKIGIVVGSFIPPVDGSFVRSTTKSMGVVSSSLPSEPNAVEPGTSPVEIIGGHCVPS